MKKSFLKLGLLTAGLTALAIPTALSITSCSTSQYLNFANGKYKLVENRNWKQNRKINLPSLLEEPQNNQLPDAQNAFVLDPNINTNAIKSIKDTFKAKLDKSALQKDFDDILIRFFKAYEFEDKTTEAEIKKITVEKVFDSYTNAKKDTEVQNLIKGDSTNKSDEYMYALINVTYDVEPEDNLRGDDSQPETRKKLFTIKPTFSTESQILSTIRNLAKMMTTQNIDDVENQGHSIDVKDLFELYYGEKKDNDNDHDFDQDDVKEQDADDQSIFKKFSSVVNDGIGGLIGYSLDITSLKYEKPTRNVIMKEIYAPSVSIQTILVPETPIKPIDPIVPNKPNETIQKLDFSLDLPELEKQALDYWKTNLVYTKQTTDGANQNINFINLLTDSNTRDWIKDKIQSIAINDINVNSTSNGKDNLLSEKAIEVVIQLNNGNLFEGNDMPQIISIVIQDSWCKQPDTSNQPQKP